MKHIIMLSIIAIMTGCAATPLSQIGKNTYYLSASNTGFTSVSNDLTTLILKGNEFCHSQNKEFELVTSNVSPTSMWQFGGASITFKCVNNAKDPVMRKDSGVTTIENR